MRFVNHYVKLVTVAILWLFHYFTLKDQLKCRNVNPFVDCLTNKKIFEMKYKMTYHIIINIIKRKLNSILVLSAIKYGISYIKGEISIF